MINYNNKTNIVSCYVIPGFRNIKAKIKNKMFIINFHKNSV